MFYDNYVRLCNTVGKSPSAVAVALGLKKATVTRWKKGGTPTDANAQKIADYFGVTVDFLLGKEENTVFYDRFVELCNLKGVSRTKACMDCGVSRTAWHKWENGATPNGATINKFSAYFGVSVGYLLGAETKKAPTPESERTVSDDDIKFALFGGEGEVTDEMYEEVKRFAQMVKLREEAEKKKKG